MTRRRWLLLALVVVMLAAGGGLQWWRTHPTLVFHQKGAGMRPHQPQVGDAYNTSVFRAVKTPVTLKITAFEPNFREDSTDAKVDLLVCTPPDGKKSQVGYGMDDAWTADHCATLEPAVGHEWTFGDGAGRELLVRVEPRQPGRLKMDGILLAYDLGWQRAQQQAGDELVLKVRG